MSHRIPPGAEASLATDGHSCTTPCTLTAPNGIGTYNVSFNLNGYQPQSVPVRIAVNEFEFHAIRRRRHRLDHGHHAGPGHGRTRAACSDSHKTARRAHKGKAREESRRDLRTAARFVTSAARDENRRGFRNAACFITSTRDDNRRGLRNAACVVTRCDPGTAACFVTSAGRDDNRGDLGTTTRGLARSKGKAWGLG